jgi:choice-of-anchor B domain-containing protein
MRKTIVPAAIIIAIVTSMTALRAQEFGSVRFLANYVPPSGGGYTSGCWGWTDTASGREYALLGNYSGTAVVEITDIGNIVERGFVPGPSSSWREIMTWQHYAYVVSEGGGGTQIIDLSTLPDSVRLVRSFIYTSGGNSSVRAHTVHTHDGYLYLNGCANWSPGGILIFDLADPENPLFTGEYARNYIHDCFVRNDTIYGAGIYGIGLDIIDATDKYAPQYLATISYPGAGTHNAATTGDGRYVLTTDEVGSTTKTLKIWDLSSMPYFPMVAEYAGSPTAIVHNVFVKDTLAIMSYYTAGIRVVDIADPEHPATLGGYDTRPSDESSTYTGAWSVYPYFPSGKIIIGDMGEGMFVVDMNTAAPRVPSGVTVYSDYLTPSSVSLSWTDPVLTVAGDPFTTTSVHLFRDGAFLASAGPGTGVYTDTGLTLHRKYSYAVVAIGASDSSTAVTRTVYAGGAAEPAPPSGFRVVDLSEGVRLEWTNPRSQADGTPLNDIGAVEINRDGVFLADKPVAPPDTGAAVSWTDTTAGYHRYRIRSRDTETPSYFSPFSDSLLGYGGLLTSYAEGFETGAPTSLRGGTWDTTGALAYSGERSMTDSPGGNYPNSADYSFVTPRFVVSPGMTLTFKQIAILLTADFGFVEITKDRGKTYTALKGYNSFLHAEWQDGSADPGDWFGESIPLAAYAGDTVALRFRLRSDAGGNADGWYIDDIVADDWRCRRRGRGPRGVRALPERAEPLQPLHDDPFRPPGEVGGEARRVRPPGTRNPGAGLG